ncbi:MAG: flavodoxin [Clostridiales bacterium]|nr:flavodoxin [Clostridiales bacterium]
MNKNLVVYFTHRGETYFPDGYRVVEKGNSEILSEKVASIIPADIFEIKTEKEYPISYKECCDVAKIEQQKGELPKLKKYLDSIEQYENIIVIFPCWWGTMPQAVFSFLDHYNLDGKGLFPICTHEGTGLGRSMRDLELVAPNAILYDGYAIEGHLIAECDEELTDYLKEWL